ncbi:MAG: peptide ABC transporter substrate-binding protein [Myxococcales bacterium]|nr:peptide ABC transporter substrate-binding protein [Myxococcales bacterium]
MWVKRLLLLVPGFLALILWQSYFWVPSYEKQTVGNPDRLHQFISATSGDARLLNPIVSADSASSSVVAYVFDTLLELDENFELKAGLAHSWELSAIATLAVPTSRSAQRLLADLSGALPEGVTGSEVLPAEREPVVIDPDGPGPLEAAEVTLLRPERLRFFLDRVAPEFFDELSRHLPADYTEAVAADRRVLLPESAGDAHRLAAEARVPARRIQPVIEFWLRDDVHFHDGEALTADDVIFTYGAIMDPKNLSPRASDFEPIERVERIGDYQLKVVYKRLFSPAIAAWTYMGILPEHRLNEAALEREMDERNLSADTRERFGIRDSRFNRSPVGTGAFRFGYWRTDEVIYLTRNDTYWNGPPEYRELYIRVIPDPVAREVEFRAGAADIYDAQPHQAARYLKDPAYQPFTSLGLGYSYIGYNIRRPPFDDPRVRRALGMAIDTEQIIEYVLYGEGEHITGPYPIQSDWYNPDVAPIPYDPEGALALLAEAGFEKNAAGWLERNGKEFSFQLITNNGNPQRKAILTIAQNAWQKLGVRCETRVFEWSVFLKDFVNTAEFDAVVLGWSLSPLDPDLYQIWHSSQTGPQQLNFVGYENAKVDDLIVSLRREYDRDRQIAMSRELHAQIAQDQPYTFLFVGRSTTVVDRKIVMTIRDERGEVTGYEPIRPTPTGQLSYFFNRWTKIDAVPES